jgi:hypothetical protein
MSKTVVADISDDLLKSGTADSDRVVYSNYFVPLLINYTGTSIPIIPLFVQQQLAELVTYGGIDRDRLQQVMQYLGIPEAWAINDVDRALEMVRSAELEASRRPPIDYRHARHWTATTFARDSLDAGDDSAALRERSDPDRASTLAAALAAAIDRTAARSASDAPPPTVRINPELELVAGLLQSTVGIAFLDRTRISPVGFAIGEHVYALGLAPGEEAVLEQKTFTKRQSTFEEQTEQERQFDIELSSAYSTELQEGMEHQRSQSDSWGLHVNHTGSYSSPISPYGQWNGNHTIDYTTNVKNASQEALRRSVKDGQQASGKVSARYRTQHKTLFRITMEQVFEATSRRTIRNPNRATPITLHYFKVMQRLRLRQERYGVRLCWAPSVSDPGQSFYARVQQARQQIIDTVTSGLGQRPDQPSPTGGGNTVVVKDQMSWSEPVPANQQNPVNGQRSDYDVEVPVPDGWSWDGSMDNVVVDDALTLRTKGTYDIYKTGHPTVLGDSVKVRVHVDAGDRTGAQPIVFQVGIRCVQDQTIPDTASDDAVYQAALEDWRLRVKEWEEARDKAIDDAHKSADELEQRMFAQFSPVNELVSQLVDRYFHPNQRVYQAWEIDYWQRLFDWERASYSTYPQWWSGHPSRDPTRDPADFINASWAKLYLPVRVGMEQAALRWIYGWAAARKLEAGLEKRFEQVVEELKQFRIELLGTGDEVSKLDAACA